MCSNVFIYSLDIPEANRTLHRSIAPVDLLSLCYGCPGDFLPYDIIHSLTRFSTLSGMTSLIRISLMPTDNIWTLRSDGVTDGARLVVFDLQHGMNHS